jgi:LysM repeat protein
VSSCLTDEIPAAQRHQRQRTVKTYRVVRGDSLSRIAQRHGVSVAALMTHNQLRSTVIHPGQLLHVPPKAGAPKPRPAPVQSPDPPADLASESAAAPASAADSDSDSAADSAPDSDSAPAPDSVAGSDSESPLE